MVKNLLATVFCLSVVFSLWPSDIATAQAPQVKCSQSGTTVDCRIDKPNVKQRRTEYHAVSFHPNDTVVVRAGGCVQTGGIGKTWKRYVNPQGPNSDRLYHGLISLPGVTGPDLMRIQGVVGKKLSLPPTIDPSMAFLVLGYEDDDYGDNGYDGHDDGTGGQCMQGTGRDGGPAWVTIHIERGGGGQAGELAPFDLVATDFDPSGIPMNPRWGWEKAHQGDHPNPMTMCGGLPYLNPSDPSLGVGLGTPPCTKQSPSVNPPSGFNDYLCAGHAQPGHLHGHLNWWTTAFAGVIQWVDHTDWTQLGDDDYNFKLTPHSATGLTTSNPQTIGLEFDSDETVDHIDRGWWNDFHRAVDSNDGKSGGPAGSMIDSHEAIAIGLMGLDSEHGAYSELHPIYGLAIHLTDSPTNDTWALLARNWGNEGFCSQDSMALPTRTLSFFLPRPGASGGTANTDELYSNNDKTIAVLTKPGGALVTLDLGEPQEGTLVHGRIRFSWALAPGAPAKAIAAAVVAMAPPAAVTAREGPELRLRSLIEGLPQAKQAQIESQLRKTPQATYTRPLRRVPTIAVTHATAPLRPKRLPNPRKAERERHRLQALCSAYGGRLPGASEKTCSAVQ